jgi:acyl carrier protein
MQTGGVNLESIEVRIIGAVQSLVPSVEFSVTSNSILIDLGIDSMRLAVLGMDLEESLGVQLSDLQVQKILSAQTVEQIISAFSS